jgi:acetyl-CoA carboxylase biotin carboxyl carrier protein
MCERIPWRKTRRGISLGPIRATIRLDDLCCIAKTGAGNQAVEPELAELQRIMARQDVRSEITARVWKIEVKAGDRVAIDDAIMILESMKMEIPVPAPAAGTIVEIKVAEKDMVEEGQVVAIVEI